MIVLIKLIVFLVLKLLYYQISAKINRNSTLLISRCQLLKWLDLNEDFAKLT